MKEAKGRASSSRSKSQRESSRQQTGQAVQERKESGRHSKAVMFSLSPRTLDQTVKGAPAVFKCAQEVDLGRYDRGKLGMSVPGGWDQDPKHRTRTELLEARRKSKIPDPTFDLDGDGIVSREEYILSVKYDKDRDGKLCTPERDAALRALKDNHPLTKFTSTRPKTVPVKPDGEVFISISISISISVHLSICPLHVFASPHFPCFIPSFLTGQMDEAAGQGQPERPKTRTELMQKRKEENLHHNQRGYEQYEDAVSKVRSSLILAICFSLWSNLASSSSLFSSLS